MRTGRATHRSAVTFGVARVAIWATTNRGTSSRPRRTSSCCQERKPSPGREAAGRNGPLVWLKYDMGAGERRCRDEQKRLHRRHDRKRWDAG